MNISRLMAKRIEPKSSMMSAPRARGLEEDVTAGPTQEKGEARLRVPPCDILKFNLTPAVSGIPPKTLDATGN
jgi:hypothetical protein